MLALTPSGATEAYPLSPVSFGVSQLQEVFSKLFSQILAIVVLAFAPAFVRGNYHTRSTILSPASGVDFLRTPHVGVSLRLLLWGVILL